MKRKFQSLFLPLALLFVFHLLHSPPAFADTDGSEIQVVSPSYLEVGSAGSGLCRNGVSVPHRYRDLSRPDSSWRGRCSSSGDRRQQPLYSVLCQYWHDDTGLYPSAGDHISADEHALCTGLPVGCSGCAGHANRSCRADRAGHASPKYSPACSVYLGRGCSGADKLRAACRGDHLL